MPAPPPSPPPPPGSPPPPSPPPGGNGFTLTKTLSGGSWSASVRVGRWVKGQAVAIDFGAPTTIEKTWHAQVFSSTPTGATFRLDPSPGPGASFQLKAKGTPPTEPPAVVVGEVCNGAKFEVTRSSEKNGAVGFTAAVAPATWRAYQTVALSFDARAIGGVVLSRAYHATLVSQGGRRANFALEAKGDAGGRMTLTGSATPAEGYHTADVLRALKEAGGVHIVCRALKVPPRPPPPPSPPAVAPPPPRRPLLVLPEPPRVTSVGCGSVVLEWDPPPVAPSEALRYRVKWRPSDSADDEGDAAAAAPSGRRPTKAQETDSPRLAVQKLASGTSYEFSVQIYRDAWGAASAPASARTYEQAVCANQPAPLAPSSNPAATAATAAAAAASVHAATDASRGVRMPHGAASSTAPAGDDTTGAPLPTLAAHSYLSTLVGIALALCALLGCTISHATGHYHLRLAVQTAVAAVARPRTRVSFEAIPPSCAVDAGDADGSASTYSSRMRTSSTKGGGREASYAATPDDGDAPPSSDRAAVVTHPTTGTHSHSSDHTRADIKPLIELDE